MQSSVATGSNDSLGNTTVARPVMVARNPKTRAKLWSRKRVREKKKARTAQLELFFFFFFLFLPMIHGKWANENVVPAKSEALAK